MKIFLSCPNCKSQKVLHMSKLLNSRNILQTFKDNKTYCEECLNKNLGKIVMKVDKFDREEIAETIPESHQLHVPTFTDKDRMTVEQIQKKENLKKILKL